MLVPPDKAPARKLKSSEPGHFSKICSDCLGSFCLEMEKTSFLVLGGVRFSLVFVSVLQLPVAFYELTEILPCSFSGQMLLNEIRVKQ